MQETQITHLQKIEIKGLWSKYNIEWELHPEVNILAGANGTGKTTVLNLIAGVLTGGPFAKKVDEQIDEIEITLNNGKTVRVFSDTISNLLKRADEDNQVRIALQELSQRASRDRDVETRGNKKIGVFDLTPWEGMTGQNLRDCLPTISVVSTFDEPIRDLYKTIEFQAAPKEVETFLDFLIYKIQRAYLSYQIDLGKKFERAILLEHEHLDAKRQREEIYSKKDLFYQTVNELFQETGKTIESDKQNEIAFRQGEPVLTPYQLSSGEKQVLLILLTVLIQDNQPAILLMDEPEISLHVEWQNRLLDDLRQLNNHLQIIAATHSPGLIMLGWGDNVTQIEKIIELTKHQ
jgi:predicted ATPase